MCDTKIVNEDINDADFEPALDISLLPKVNSNSINCTLLKGCLCLLGREEQDQGAQEDPV